MAPRTPNRSGAAATAPPPLPTFDIPARPRDRVGSVGPHNGGQDPPARREAIDKITNMLSVAFISEAQAAGRVDTVPLHKLGIKATLPKAYEGQSDQTSFENWLSLLLGFFRIHQLDVLNETQDRARLEILGQALKDSAHTYFRERHQSSWNKGVPGTFGRPFWISAIATYTRTLRSWQRVNLRHSCRAIATRRPSMTT